MKTTWAIIANPQAGNRTKGDFWLGLEQLLTQAGISFEFFFTQARGHAEMLAREILAQGYARVAVLGGDGTFSEAVSGLMSAENRPDDLQVALLPFGTGNDWGRYWGLDRRLENSVQVLAAGRTRLIDIGKITFHGESGDEVCYFDNAFGMGFDAKVVALSEKLQHLFKGQSWTYSMGVLLSIFANRSQRMRFELDQDAWEHRVYTVSCGNGCYTGGGIKQTPDADPTDGKLDVMAMENLSLSKIARGVSLLFRGRLLEHPSVHLWRTAKLSVSSEQPIYTELDGILHAPVKSLDVEVLPQALRFVCP